jgi:hypothetical protein
MLVMTVARNLHHVGPALAQSPDHHAVIRLWQRRKAIERQRVPLTLSDFL